MEKFVPDCEIKIPSMKIQVYGRDKKLKREYEVQRGFQLEKYILSLYINSTLIIKLIDDDFWIAVYGKDLIEIHIGKYDDNFFPTF